jgi:ABC-type taurine transport system ATPase subunit
VKGAFTTLNPIIQMLRPISPIAWIPIAILWFGVGNASPIYLIFISSVFPMVVQTTAGVHTIERRYLRAAQNFGGSRYTLFRRVVIPAVLPQIIVGMRIGLGVAWLVVRPEILYMDEPFAALDALLNLRMRCELLRILAKERHTVLLITHDVEEAIHIADRVIVFSDRPTTIQATFEVPFPHPRKLSSRAMQELRVSILRELGVDS